MISNSPRRHTPLWVVIVIILCMLPVVALPSLLSACPSGNDAVRTLLMCYPVYVVAAGWLAWVSWDARPYMTWILLILMLLSHASAWALVMMP